MAQSRPFVPGQLPILLRPQSPHFGESVAQDAVDTLMNSVPLRKLVGQLFYSHENNTYFRVHGIQVDVSMSDGFQFMVQYENAW